MPLLKIRSTAQARVDEEWIVNATDEQARLLLAAPHEFETLMATEDLEVVTVENVQVYNEEDREVTGVDLEEEA